MNDKEDVVTIGGKEYFKVEQLYIKGEDFSENEEEIKELGGIRSKYKKIHRGGLLSRGYAIIEYYIPSSKMEEYVKLCLEAEVVG